MRPFGATSVRRDPATLLAHPCADAAIPILPATRVLLAAQMGLPGCALVLARRLRRCAIGQEVAQKAYTLMQDLTFCLIIPLVYVILRESSSFCLASPYASLFRAHQLRWAGTFVVLLPSSHIPRAPNAFMIPIRAHAPSQM